MNQLALALFAVVCLLSGDHALLSQDQSTVAPQAEMTVAEISVGSYVPLHFPDRFPNYLQHKSKKNAGWVR